MDNKIVAGAGIIGLLLVAVYLILGSGGRTGNEAQSVGSAFTFTGVGYLRQPASASNLTATSSNAADITKTLTVYCTNQSGNYVAENLTISVG